MGKKKGREGGGGDLKTQKQDKEGGLNLGNEK
jgi:hypothetical protein